MIPVYEITLDDHTPTNPIHRVMLRVEGLPRNEAVLLAEAYMRKTGFRYEVAFVHAGHKQED